MCQIAFAIAMQKTGGTFVLKIFDVFMQSTLDLLYILSICYERVFIIKPNTSRIANSEKYIVCKKFKLDDSCRQETINVFYKLMMQLNKLDNPFIYHIDRFYLVLFFKRLAIYFNKPYKKFILNNIVTHDGKQNSKHIFRPKRIYHT